MKKKLIALLLAILTLNAFCIPTLAANKSHSTAAARAQKKLAIKEVEYEADDKELEVEFNCKDRYKKPRVTVRNAKGKKLKVKLLEKDNDSIEVRVKGMKLGKCYTVRVSGVRAKNAKKFTSVSKRFTAVND